jgi:secreted trypsin-like serine protease
MVLTAAHCIENRISAKVQINRNEWRNSNVGEEIDVKEFIIHPNFRFPRGLDHDYALLVLESATTQDIKLIGLNSDENFPAPDSPSRVMGWGRTEENKPSDVALEVGVNVISNAECGAGWAGTPVIIAGFHICTFEQDKSMCQGDSGEIELSVVI